MKSTFIQQLINTAESYADKTAIVDHDGKRQSTYGEFLTLARKVAAYIQSQGITPQSFVCIQLPSSMEYAAAELGVWMSRCISVPLGMTFPQKRVDYIYNHCQACMIIDADIIDEAKSLAPAKELLPEQEDNAMLVYTSGSTGNPKGILHTFDVFDYNYPHSFDLAAFDPDTVFGTSAPFYFVAKVYTYETLSCGGAAHLYSDDVKTDVQRLADYILEHGITVSFISPAVLANFHNKSNSLKAVISGSEKLTTQCSKDGYVLYNTYGLSETYAVVTWYEMPDKPMQSAPIGRTINNVEFAILNEDGQPVAPSEIGELCLKGHFCKEYFKEPELTERLYSGGWLHTNDLARVGDDGLLYYVQRKDWMVKINGQRVEPGEVESVMRSIEGVKGAVVKGFDNGQGSNFLCAFYISDTLTADELKNVLAQRLPSYMVPSFFVKMEAFPLNANGKIDRKNMQAPDTAALTEEYVAPSDNVEATLCNAFAAAIGLERIGANDDFFKLGGNSIQTMKIQQFCIDQDYDTFSAISTKIIHQGRTPKGIAILLSQTTKRVKEKLDDYPLNGIQQGYFEHCIQHEGEPVFNIYNLIKLDNEVDMPRLAAAIETMADAHPGLKTRLLINEAGEVRQKCATGKLDLQIEHMSDQEFETEKQNLVQPFYYLKERLSRFRLICTDSAKYLFYDIHHLIVDGTSLSILLNDIEKAYQGQPLEPEDWNSFEMAAEDYHLRQTEVYAKAKQWFHDMYHDAPVVKRPDAEPNSSPKMSLQDFTLSISPKDVEQFCDDNGTTVNILTSSAFALLLGKFAEMQDVVYASAYDSREDIRVKNTVSCFARPLFVRSRWTNEQSVGDFLTSMRKILMECMDNSIYTNEGMPQYFTQPPGYLFIYQGDLLAKPTIGGKPTEAISISEKQAVSAIEFHLTLDKAQNAFVLQVQYKPDYFTAEFIERMAANYQLALTGLMQENTLEKISDKLGDKEVRR